MDVPTSLREVEELDTEALKDLEASSAQTADEIQYQIEVSFEGDLEWRARATKAMRVHRRAVQYAQQVLSDRRKAARVTAGCRLANAFVDAARRMLDPDRFQEVMSEAEATHHSSL